MCTCTQEQLESSGDWTCQWCENAHYEHMLACEKQANEAILNPLPEIEDFAFDETPFFDGIPF